MHIIFLLLMLTSLAYCKTECETACKINQFSLNNIITLFKKDLHWEVRDYHLNHKKTLFLN